MYSCIQAKCLAQLLGMVNVQTYVAWHHEQTLETIGLKIRGNIKRYALIISLKLRFVIIPIWYVT